MTFITLARWRLTLKLVWAALRGRPLVATKGRPRRAAHTSFNVRRQRANVMKVILPGGTGQVGTVLARAFHQRGDEVVVLSRRPQAAPWRVVTWDAATTGE